MDVAALVMSLAACWVALWRPGARRWVLAIPLLILVVMTYRCGSTAPRTFASLFLAVAAGVTLWWSLPVADGHGERGLVAQYLLGPSALLGLLWLVVGLPGGRSLALGRLTTVHLWLLACAGAAAAAAAGAACALVVQDHSLRTKRPLPHYIGVPSLAAADGAVHAMTGLTLVLLTAAMLAAMPTTGSLWGGWRWEPRTLGACGLWLLYAVGLHMRRIAGWRGRRFAMIALTGFAVLSTVTLVALAKVGP